MNADDDYSGRNARRAGIIGAIAGLAAAGVAAGVGTQRYLVNRARQDPQDPYADEPFGALPVDRTRQISTIDDISIHVETVDSRELDGRLPTATVVFVHGYCLDQGTFHFQRRALTESDLPVRAVYYDQPGHGQSGPLPDLEYDIEGLAETLYSVLAHTAPTGPIILVGHSMGGMTIMAFARLHPEFFAERVKGVALLSTSGGGLDRVKTGAPRVLARARKYFMPTLGRVATMTPGTIDGVRKVAGDLAWLLTRRYGFADAKPSPSLVSYVEKMNTDTPIQTVMGYSRTLLEHDEYDSLALLAKVPVLISCGDDDQFTPASHAKLLAEALPQAKLDLVPDAAHVALMEKPEAVTGVLMDHLRQILEGVDVQGVTTETKRSKTWRRKHKEE